MNCFFMHYCFRIGVAFAAFIVIVWIRYNDSKRARRHLERQGDLPDGE
jgi:cbb3-type cytochrome oxidase subunit 3